MNKINHQIYKKVFSNNSGFSLIELLVSIALLSILGGISVSIYAVINNSYNMSNTLSKMQTQGSQAMEVMQRSIRTSANIFTATAGNNGCSNTQCLIIEVPSNSIEYEVNGGCKYTVYGWTDKTANQNGSIVRYYLNQANSLCNGSIPIHLFDTDPRHGVSVEQLSGDIFTVNSGSRGIDSVDVNMELSPGVSLTTERVSLPIRTKVSLRDY